MAEANKSKKNKTRVPVIEGRVYVTATFNNTLITITDMKGDTLAASSAGAAGFKGARKSTPYAATTAVENVGRKVMEQGLKKVEVFVRGPGSGRDSAIRALKNMGLQITAIADVTPIPHNGPRPRKRRRV